MIRLFVLLVMLLVPSSAFTAEVVALSGEKMPKLPPGLNLTSVYSAGPAPSLDFKGSSRDILRRLVPNGWKVNLEKSIAGRSTVFVSTPTESWMAALERWIAQPKYRALVRPETHEVFVRQSSGGYPYTDIKPYGGTPSNPETWAIRGGLPLKTQLQNWCVMAGYTLFWEAPLDYKMKGSAAFDGTFEAAVQQLFDVLYYNGEMSLKATIYRGNHVVRVRLD